MWSWETMSLMLTSVCQKELIPGFGREMVIAAAHLNLGWMQGYPGRRLQNVFEGLHSVRHCRGWVLWREELGCGEEAGLH